jgi:hypothetical protein
VALAAVTVELQDAVSEGAQRRRREPQAEQEIAMWGLSDALDVIREIQPTVREFGFHVALAGSVLNKGTSEKDLDLVFIPLTNLARPVLGPLCTWFVEQWGLPQDNVTDPTPCIALRHQASHMLGTKRIDVFVV